MSALVKFACFIGIGLQSCSNPGSNASGHDELILAHVIHRHGERNIIYSFPKNPYNDDKYWNGGYGALTNTGKRQAYELGSFLRGRYANLIGTSFSSGKVSYRSTDSSRTLMTAHCCATGLFNQHNNHGHNVQCQRMPIFRVTPYYEDYLLHPSANCKRFGKLLNDYLESRQVKSLLRRNRALIKSIEKNTGLEVHHLADISRVYDTLYVENQRGLPLSPGLNELWRSKDTLERLAAANFASHTHTKTMKKLKAGYLIAEMLDRFKRMANFRPKSNHRLYIYSTHDIKIVQLLDTLNLFDNKVPPYASSVHFELYRRGTEHYVQLFYRNSPTQHLSPLNIPHCGTKCPLYQFEELYKHIIPHREFFRACRV